MRLAKEFSLSQNGTSVKRNYGQPSLALWLCDAKAIDDLFHGSAQGQHSRSGLCCEFLARSETVLVTCAGNV
jgi:hypothetical protein